MKTEKKVAVVTGGTRGIGRAIALQLAGKGYDLLIVYGRNRKEADKTVQLVEEKGAEVMALQGDVADEKEMTRVFAEAEQRFGGIDLVVHSAGILVLGTVVDFDLDELDRLHRVNIRGTFVVNQLAARKVRPGGAIINLSTSVTKLAFPQYAPYAASKGAVNILVPILAKELRGRDITVNAVAPGPTATDLFFEGKSDETVERLTKVSPLERLGSPEDIAEAVSFLAGPGRWINGQIIYANGGIV